MFKKTGEVIVDESEWRVSPDVTGHPVYELVESVPCIFRHRYYPDLIGSLVNIIAICEEDGGLILDVGDNVLGWEDKNFGPGKYLYANSHWVEVLNETPSR